MYEFQWPTRTLFGPGLADRIEEWIKVPDQDDASIVLVAPREPWVKSLFSNLKKQLKRSGWSNVAVFAEVEPNPSWETTVERGHRFIQCEAAAAVLGIDGGSVLDAAKVITARGGVDFL